MYFTRQENIQRVGIITFLSLGLMILFISGCETNRVPQVLSKSSYADARWLPESEDPEYGYTPEKPIMAGNLKIRSSEPELFVRILEGPDGRPQGISQVGTCCPFPLPGEDGAMGEIEIWKLGHSGLREPKYLYVNPYVFDNPQIPVGFRQSSSLRRYPLFYAAQKQARQVDHDNGLNRSEAIVLARLHIIQELGSYHQYGISQSQMDVHELPDGDFLVITPKWQRPQRARLSPEEMEQYDFEDEQIESKLPNGDFIVIYYDSQLYRINEVSYQRLQGEGKITEGIIQQMVEGSPRLYLKVDQEGNVKSVHEEILTENGGSK